MPTLAEGPHELSCGCVVVSIPEDDRRVFDRTCPGLRRKLLWHDVDVYAGPPGERLDLTSHPAASTLDRHFHAGVLTGWRG